MRSILWLVLTLPSQAPNPVCIKHILVPGYPSIARSATLQGTVVVEVETGSDGSVVSKRSSGASGILRRASEENVTHWTFCPAPVSDTPTKKLITYTYKLEGEKEYPYDSPPIVTIDLPDHVEITARPPETQTDRQR